MDFQKKEKETEAKQILIQQNNFLSQEKKNI